MLAIYGRISQDHDTATLLVALFICATGASATFALWHQIKRTAGLRRSLLSGLAAITAASSVWATHFAAMTGHVHGLDRPISMLWTGLSIFCAVFFYVFATRSLTKESKTQIQTLQSAGLLTIAVSVMHYTGIRAFGESVLIYNDAFFAGKAVVLAFCCNLAVTHFYSHPRQVLRIAAAPFFFCLGIVSLHFVAMIGTTLVPLKVDSRAHGIMAPIWLRPGLVVAVLIIATGSAIAVLMDRSKIRKESLETQRLRRLTEKLKRANGELVTARDAAEQATRSKSRFLANMSHEIRTPLNGVLGMAEALSETPLSPEQRECLDAIQSSGRALIEIISDILDISKFAETGPKLNVAPFDLHDLLEDVATLMAPLADAKGLRLYHRIAPGGAQMVIGDKGRVRQIIVNLLGNAIKFTETGSVTLEQMPQRGDAPVEIFVRDTGPGISPANQRVIFNPFEQASHRITTVQGGTGLGLTISRALANVMGGDLTVESEIAKGSNFRLALDLPLGEQPRVRPTATGRFGLFAPDPFARDIWIELLNLNGAEPVVLHNQSEIAQADDLNGILVCCETPAHGAIDPPTCPVLMVGSAQVLAAQGAQVLPNVTRMLRPVRRSKLTAWLRDPKGAAPPKPITAPELIPEAQRRRILIVDDNKTNRLVLRAMLAREGYALDEAADGQEAVALAGTSVYACILMDVSMPILNGLDATGQIRAAEQAQGRTACPIIGVTAHAFEDDRGACLAAGMDGVLAKPVAKRDLCAMLAVHVPDIRTPCQNSAA